MKMQRQARMQAQVAENRILYYHGMARHVHTSRQALSAGIIDMTRRLYENHHHYPAYTVGASYERNDRFMDRLGSDRDRKRTGKTDRRTAIGRAQG